MKSHSIISISLDNTDDGNEKKNYESTSCEISGFIDFVFLNYTYFEKKKLTQFIDSIFQLSHYPNNYSVGEFN